MIGLLVTWEAREPGVTLADWRAAAEVTGLPQELWPEVATPEQVVVAAVQAAKQLHNGKFTVKSERHTGALVWRVTGGRRKQTAILFRRATEDILIQYEKHPFAQDFAAAQADLVEHIPRATLSALLLSLLGRYRAFQLEAGLWYVPTRDPSEPIWEALRETFARLPRCRLGVYPVEDSIGGRASLAEGVAVRVQAELDKPRRNSRKRAGELATLAAGVDTVSQAIGADLGPLGHAVVNAMQEMRAALRLPVAPMRWKFRPSDDAPPPLHVAPVQVLETESLSEMDDVDEDSLTPATENPRKRRAAIEEDPSTLSERQLRKLGKKHGIRTAGLTPEQIIAELGAL